MVNGQLSELLYVVCGVPQGSTLGPLLFLLYINDLANASSFLTSLFADDTCLLMSDSNLSTLKYRCNAELVYINNWFLANKLTANLSKASKYMLTLGKSRQTQPSDFIIKMGNATLEQVKSIKYLGVIFDDQFKWDKHVSYITSKLSCSVGIISKLRYYTNTQTLLLVYNALVGSHLTYALISWGSTSQTNLQPLRVLQNRAIRHISRAPRFRRLDVDFLNLRILKLDDLYKLALSKFMYQYHYNKLPDYFRNFFPVQQISHNYQTRHRLNSSTDPCPIECNKVSMQRSIRFSGPKIWSEIPNHLREMRISIFKKEITNIILAKY